MNQSTAYATDIEQAMANHVELLFSVAAKLAGNSEDAERITRLTLHQALRTPEKFEEPMSVKRELLTLLRNNSIRIKTANHFAARMQSAQSLALAGA